MSTHVGRIILSLNGVPRAEAKSIRVKTMTGKDIVKGMNPLGIATGTVDGTKTYEISGEFYVPKVGVPVDWDNLDNAVLSIQARDGIGPVVMFTGVFTKDTELSFSEEDSATRSVTLGALNKVEL